MMSSAMVIAKSATENPAFLAMVFLAYACNSALCHFWGLSKSFSGVGLPTNASFCGRQDAHRPSVHAQLAGAVLWFTDGGGMFGIDDGQNALR